MTKVPQHDQMKTQNKGSETQTGHQNRHKKVRKKKSILGHAIGAVFSFSLVITIVTGISFAWFQNAVKKDGPHSEDVVIDIPRGLGVRQISTLLAQHGVLNQPMVFLFQVKWDNAARELKAGEMIFPAMASVEGVIDILKAGQTVQYTLTIPEGLTSQQVLALINDHPKLKGDVPTSVTEGSLKPETYTFPRGYNRSKLVQDMQQSMQSFLLEEWAQRDSSIPIKTPLEAVTLASIVEKETGVSDERELVASVFINRLNKGMRLQSDPTVIYGLVGGAGTLGRQLYRSDWKSDTPYNTYIIKGLPPGPIANPGRESIKAVLNPARSSYFYFVADGTGGHAFAETLKQHNINVARWRKIRDQ